MGALDIFINVVGSAFLVVYMGIILLLLARRT